MIKYKNNLLKLIKYFLHLWIYSFICFCWKNNYFFYINIFNYFKYLKYFFLNIIFIKNL